MLLYLVQHAQSLSKDVDPERPLSDEGVMAIERTAAYAAEHIKIDLGQIHHSGKKRAAQTADLLGHRIKVSGEIKASDGLSPMDDPAIWANRLREWNENVMLVGHLPHLQRLASLLLSGDPDRPVVGFRNAGMVCLERDEQGSWSLIWAIVPDVL
jgi:phosphohistidine phosphatase